MPSPGTTPSTRPDAAEGRLPESSREIALSDTLAGARGLHPGDWYELTLTGTGRYLRVRISGLVKDPECLYYVNTTTPAPDLTHYAFAVHGTETLLQELMGANRYNQICITTDGSLSAARLRLAVDAALGDRVVNILSLEDNTQAYYSAGDAGTIMAPRYSTCFPVLFFLCAVLMMVSTMNRLIERTPARISEPSRRWGTLTAKIMCYYLLHALLVVVVGFPVGDMAGAAYVSALIVCTIAIGCYLLALYGGSTTLPPAVRALGHDRRCAASGSAWLVCPLAAEGDPGPVYAAQAAQEHEARGCWSGIGPVWHRLGFNQKYIIRNTLRNKVRMATCIFGIAFCMALVLSGLCSAGLHSGLLGRAGRAAEPLRPHGGSEHVGD